MNTNHILSPELFHATAIFIIALTILQIAAYSGFIALAARKTNLSPQAQWGVPLVVAASLAAWLGWAILGVSEPVTVPEPPSTGVQNAAVLLKMGAFFSLSLIALFASKSMRAISAATPPAWLIGVQIYRAAGILFLWPFLASGALPTSFALVAGIGDMITGIAAPFVARALYRNQPGARARAIAWNCFGMLDFIVAVTVAVLTHSSNIGHFPLVIIQVFVVPIGLLAHISSLRNLSSTADRAPEAGLAHWRAKAA